MTGGGGGGAESYDGEESLALYKSFNILWLGVIRLPVQRGRGSKLGRRRRYRKRCRKKTAQMITLLKYRLGKKLHIYGNIAK
jgi:hypothetical protein